jgi:radical SAM protein (TIGR04043 family)/putative N-acetyltransferase (TIGR04045 family)
MIPELITELQSLGLRLEGGSSERKGGAGPAEGVTFLIGGIPVSCPTGSRCVSRSPYILKEEDSRWRIFKDGKAVCHADFIKKPKFYDHVTEEGIPCSRIALLHGKDCLATTIIQTCTYWPSSERCRFCGIELSYRNHQTIRVKSPHQLSEVALKAKELDSIEHIVLTTGTLQPPGEELSYLTPCASAIKQATGLPIHAQFCPPSSVEGFYALKEAGVDTVGIHIESFDLEVLSKVAPAKAAMGLERYEKAWRAAVEIFGPSQVSSFLIVGLGEARDSVISGSKFLADLGVYPFVIPLRPIPGSLMEDVLPPDPEEMKRIYGAVASILKRKGLSASQSLAGCVRCGACSALSLFEGATDLLICHPVRTKAEREMAFGIRKEVFVSEQKIFSNSDLDENDPKSTHLVAEWNNQVVGTVRVFPANHNGHWVGGRLAVKKEYRNTGAGELLVREAIQCVKSRGCTRFTAHIQSENVPFFSRLGWKTVGSVKDYLGKPHQLMEANLEDI